MSIEELIELIESVLEMDEQADRSVALANIREAVTGLDTQINDLNSEVARLMEIRDNLTARNNELFLRVEGAPKEDTPPTPSDPEEVYNDLSLFS